MKEWNADFNGEERWRAGSEWDFCHERIRINGYDWDFGENGGERHVKNQ
ncbi:MAG: hypothetical protein LUD12_07015 [Lachnospiraceae bacterium]|nr:hypothetical protein [Lachnospiraceae bacterium]